MGGGFLERRGSQRAVPLCDRRCGPRCGWQEEGTEPRAPRARRVAPASHLNDNGRRPRLTTWAICAAKVVASSRGLSLMASIDGRANLVSARLPRRGASGGVGGGGVSHRGWRVLWNSSNFTQKAHASSVQRAVSGDRPANINAIYLARTSIRRGWDAGGGLVIWAFSTG